MGLIFTATRDAITARHGEDFWDDLLDDCQLDGAYTSLGKYEHEELHQIAAAAAQRLDTSTADVLRVVGVAAFAALYSKVADRAGQYKDSRSFFEAIEKHIHVEARRIYPDSQPPKFEVVRQDDMIELTYRSHRRLCHLAEGLALGLLQHFDDEGDVTQTSCVGQGGEACVLRITYAS